VPGHICCKKADFAGSTFRGSALLALASSLLFFIGSAMADDDSLQNKFNRKYQDFLTQTSQSLLPLPQISVPDWKKMLETGYVKKLYVDPDRFYNNKVYTLPCIRVRTVSATTWTPREGLGDG
jgi:hypothetical protein